VVFHMALQVLGKTVDTVSEKCNLYFW
jgi:hypothetical protein